MSKSKKQHPLFHLSEHELVMLDYPTRKEISALVGWMVLANSFGDVCSDPINFGETIPSRRGRRLIGTLSRMSGIRSASPMRAKRQTVVSDHKRKVRAR